MATGAFNPLQILETAEMNVTHENHDTMLVVMVCGGDLPQLRRLVSISHGYDASPRRNQRPHEIHDYVEARDDFRRPGDLQREVVDDRGPRAREHPREQRVARAGVNDGCAERSDALMPSDTGARARIKQWIFAALNTLEPHIQHLVSNDLFHATEDWAKVRGPVEQMVNKRLLELSARLNGHAYLEGGFTAADLMMTQVLRLLRHTGLIAEIPTLNAYCRRCEARPAFQKALAGQLAAYAGNEPAYA